MSTASVLDLIEAYRSGVLSPVEVVSDALERVDRQDATLRAFLHVSGDAALTSARASEARWRSASAGPLEGVPIAHKDILATVDAPTTGHSRLLDGWRSDRDATAVARLRAAGAVSIGKTNLSEFACGSMDLRGIPRNPWGSGIYAGGSSGGSATAVAAGLVPATTGTDTAGSIRVPASFCGLVGVKPTWGLVSNDGVVPLSWSMDTVGPLAWSVRDAAYLLSLMAEPDVYRRHATGASLAAIVPAVDGNADGLRVGVPVDHFFDGLAAPVEAAVRRALAALEADGAELVDVRLPLAGHLAAAGSVLVMSEGYAVHEASLARSAEAYGSRTRRRLVAGGAYDVRDVHRARAVAAAWRAAFDRALARVDVIVTPTLPLTAFSVERQEHDPPDTSWGTRHANLAGTPAVTLPCGLDPNGLPIGLQVFAPRFGERMALHAARCLERVIGFSERPTLEARV